MAASVAASAGVPDEAAAAALCPADPFGALWEAAVGAVAADGREVRPPPDRREIATAITTMSARASTTVTTNPTGWGRLFLAGRCSTSSNSDALLGSIQLSQNLSDQVSATSRLLVARSTCPTRSS